MRRRLRSSRLASLLVALLGTLPVAAQADITWCGSSVQSPEFIGVGLDGPGCLTVNGGSIITLSPIGSPPDHTAGINIGGNQYAPSEGQGPVTIDGASSRIDITGREAYANVGRWGTQSTGALTITNGGVLKTTILTVGRGTISPLPRQFFAALSGAGAGGVWEKTGNYSYAITTLSSLGESEPSSHRTSVWVDDATKTVTLTWSVPSAPVTGYRIYRSTNPGSYGEAAFVAEISSGTTTTYVDVGSPTTTGAPPGPDFENGATGMLTVSGSGSAIQLAGVDTGGNPGGATIGYAGGIGHVTLSGNAVMTIDGRRDPAETAPPATFSPYLIVGRDRVSQVKAGQDISSLRIDTGAKLTLTGNDLGGILMLGLGPRADGTLTVTGEGSELRIDAGGLNCCMTIGREGSGALTVDAGARLIFTDIKTGGVSLGHQATGEGTLSIRGGATVEINGSTAWPGMTVGRLGHGRLGITGGGQLVGTGTSPAGGAFLVFGGNSASVTGGAFEALISGQGSTLSLRGTDASLVLGRMPGASGTVTVDDGAAVEADLFTVGRSADSSASMTVSGGDTTISLTGDPEGTLGAGFTVGAAGTGTLTVDQGAVITIDGTATPQPTGVSVGGSVGGTGVVTISGGAQVLTDASGRACIGCTPGSTGTVTVTGADSLIDAGAFLGVGCDRDGSDGGTGTLALSEGGTARAVQIKFCGGGTGTIIGDGGTLIGDVLAAQGAVVSPGSSPGTLSIIGSFTSTGARIVLEVDANGNHDVLGVEGTAFFDPGTQIEVRVHPAFRPVGGAWLQLITVQRTPQDPVQPLLTLKVSEWGGGTVQTEGDLTTLSQPIVVVPDIDIPPTYRAVQIDIKPGVFPNVITRASAGTIPVAIISTPAFDALTVDPATITLDGAAVKLVGKGERPLCSTQDVNGDGRPDLLCHVLTSQLPAEGDGVAILDALAYPLGSPPGIPVRGADFIRIVPKEDGAGERHHWRWHRRGARGVFAWPPPRLQSMR